MPELRAGGQGNTNGLPVLRKLQCVNEKIMRFLLSAVSVSFGSEWGRDDALLISSQQCQLPCPQTCLSTLESLENFPCRVFSGLKGIVFYILKAYFHCFLKSNKVKSTLCAPLYNRLLTASLPFSPPSQSLQWCIASGSRNSPIPKQSNSLKHWCYSWESD